MCTRLYIFALSCMWITHLGAHSSYTLRIDTSQASSPEYVPAYYKGQPLTQIDEQRYQIPETHSVATFSVIIAADIAYDAHDGATIEALKLPYQQPARWFDVTYTPDGWSTQERSYDKMPQRVPEHTVYILANPDRVTGFHAYELGRGTDRRSVFAIDLSTIPEATTDETTLHAVCASIDARVFHKQQRKERQERNVTISMLYQ